MLAASHVELSRVPPYRPGALPDRLATLRAAPDDVGLVAGAVACVTEGDEVATFGVKVLRPCSLAGARKTSPADAFFPLRPTTRPMTSAAMTPTATYGAHFGSLPCPP